MDITQGPVWERKYNHWNFPYYIETLFTWATSHLLMRMSNLINKIIIWIWISIKRWCWLYFSILLCCIVLVPEKKIKNRFHYTRWVFELFFCQISSTFFVSLFFFKEKVKRATFIFSTDLIEWFPFMVSFFFFFALISSLLFSE